MLERLMRFVNNWFETCKYTGKYTIVNGALNLDGMLKQGQYFRIVGSVFNDGVYKYDDSLTLEDEEFEGEIWAMAVPKSFIELADSIEAWLLKYEDNANSPFNSESFGGYSYSKSGGYAGDSNNLSTSSWQHVFRGELNRWRKL